MVASPGGENAIYTENGQTTISGVGVTGEYTIPGLDPNLDADAVRQIAIIHEGMHDKVNDSVIRGNLSLGDYSGAHQESFDKAAITLLGIDQ
ncbi:MAG: hypothetical protein WDO68_16520 [Gammaproteobacteria bacterium]